VKTYVYAFLWGKWPRGWWRHWTRTAFYNVRSDEALGHSRCTRTGEAWRTSWIPASSFNPCLRKSFGARDSHWKYGGRP
jgi:hypothetical protein